MSDSQRKTKARAVGINHVALEVGDIDVQNALKALDCYVTFQETIEKTGIKSHIGNRAVFEIFKEDHTPPLADLFEGLE